MSTVATINADIAAARTAISNGDYASALKYAQMAQLGIVAMPRMKQGDRNELEYDQRGIAELITVIRRMRASSVGIQTTKVEKHSVDCEDYEISC